MAVNSLTPTDFQLLLQEHGFELPQWGADGSWGNETETACEQWFEAGLDLSLPPPEPPPAGSTIVPADWLPDCSMQKIIIHWTAGSYTCSATDREHYHIIVDGNGVLWRGDKSIEANVSTSDNDGYAAHTKNCNSGSIGISACCMAGAIQSPFKSGSYPLKQNQWEVLAQVAAECARKYNIGVGKKTILQHGEVQENLGIQQDGKWDICVLPWELGMSESDVGDDFRRMVQERL